MAGVLKRRCRCKEGNRRTNCRKADAEERRRSERLIYALTRKKGVSVSGGGGREGEPARARARERESGRETGEGAKREREKRDKLEKGGML